MVRLEPKDFSDEAQVEKLAQSAGLSAEDFKTRFAKFAQ
jgi:hypothetical protein